MYCSRLRQNQLARAEWKPVQSNVCLLLEVVVRPRSEDEPRPRPSKSISEAVGAIERLTRLTHRQRRLRPPPPPPLRVSQPPSLSPPLSLLPHLRALAPRAKAEAEGAPALQGLKCEPEASLLSLLPFLSSFHALFSPSFLQSSWPYTDPTQNGFPIRKTNMI